MTRMDGKNSTRRLAGQRPVWLSKDARMALDARSPISLHAQLTSMLKKEIQRGKYQDRIPSESELMETFSVSRTTLREAVSALVREGVLRKVHGKGTFIATNTGNVWVGALSSMTDTIKSLGMNPGAKLLSTGIGDDPEIARRLGCRQYYAVERLRLADETPIALDFKTAFILHPSAFILYFWGISSVGRAVRSQ